MTPDHPLLGAAATIYPIPIADLERLRKKRHLGRLVAVCEGSRPPADAELSRVPSGLALEVPWHELETWLRTMHRAGDRWDPGLLDRYLGRIGRKAGPAGYWTAPEAVFTLGEASRMLREVARRLGRTLPEPAASPPVEYRIRRKRELAQDRVYSADVVGSVSTILDATGNLEPSARELLRLLGYMASFLGPGGRGPYGFVLLPRECAPGPSRPSPLGPVRDPGALDIADPDNVVAYLRHRAVHQIHNTFREYHAADEVLAQMRDGNDAFRAAIEAACTTMMRYGEEPETLDMAYQLTSVRSSPAFYAAVLERLEAGDFPPKGPPLQQDLPADFLLRLDSPVVAGDPGLRARAERLLVAAGEAGSLLGLALRAGDGAELARRMAEAAPEDLTNWTARCLAERVAAAPDEHLDALRALGRAAPETHDFFWKALDEQAPPWLEARRGELEAVLPRP